MNDNTLSQGRFQNYNYTNDINNIRYTKDIKSLYDNNNMNIKSKENDIKEDQKIEDQNMEEPIIPKRILSDYINDQFLSDCILKFNQYNFYFHKIILCPCSDYINLLLKETQTDEKGVSTITFPYIVHI